MKRDFDEFAEDYRKIHTENVSAISGADSDYFSKYKFEEIARRIGDNTKRIKILDFGCGDGTGFTYAKMFFPNCEYVGIDVSEKSIEIARKNNFQDRANFIAYDGRRIPFENETFDLVFAACVFHHIEKAAHVCCLKEICRVLNRGGV